MFIQFSIHIVNSDTQFPSIYSIIQELCLIAKDASAGKHFKAFKKSKMCNKMQPWTTEKRQSVEQ
jgi:hypothetical protein